MAPLILVSASMKIESTLAEIICNNIQSGYPWWTPCILWGQRMHQKSCHCMYNEGLCNAQILITDKKTDLVSQFGEPVIMLVEKIVG